MGGRNGRSAKPREAWGGNAATKLTKPEVEKIEEHTGKKAEDLSEDELDAAMGELGIEGEEPSDDEVAMLEAAEHK